MYTQLCIENSYTVIYSFILKLELTNICPSSMTIAYIWIDM